MKIALQLFLIIIGCFIYNYAIDANTNYNSITSNISGIRVANKPRTVIASKVNPGYHATNATDCFINAIKTAKKGDTIVIDKVNGSDGIWRIEGRHPNWFDGRNGEDRVSNDLTIIFEEGVVLKSIDSTYRSKEGLDMLFRLENVSGWKIFGYGAKFEMNKEKIPAGEGRHSIGLYDCENILIEGLRVDGSGGDGIYIGTRSKSGYCKSITLRNMIFEHHRRQGISLISGDNICVENVKFNKTLGAQPSSGIDLEPNYKTQRLTHIKFKNIELAHNGYTGLLVALSRFNNFSIPIDVELNEIYVWDNWQDKNGSRSKYKRAGVVMGLGGGADNAVQGSVRLSNVLIKNEKFDGLFTLKHHDAYTLSFENLVIENIGISEYIGAQHAIHTSRYDYNSPTPSVGNISINGLFIREEKKKPFWLLEGDKNDGWSVDDVIIINGLVISPLQEEQGILNTTEARYGINTTFKYQNATSTPENLISIELKSKNISRGSNSFFTITRTAKDISYPLAIEYEISGTAKNMDDYDLLHGFVIIPSNSTSVDIPINTRIKNDVNKTLTITLLKTANYNLGKSFKKTLNIVS